MPHHEQNGYSTPFLPGHALLRGIAAFVVFLGHARFANLWPSNVVAVDYYNAFFYWHNHAVDIFFTLSGFILFHVHRPERPARWRNYFVSRAARIYPLYLATTAFALVLLTLGASIEYKPIPGIWPPLMTLANFAGVQQWTFLGGVNNSINFPAWSISIELLLYVTLYPLFRLLFRFTNINPKSALMFSGMALALNSFYHLGIETLSGPSLILRGVTGFVGGAFLYRAINGGKPCSFSGAIFIMSLFLSGLTIGNIISREFLPVTALPLLFQLSILKNTKFEAVCRSFGDLSYAVYLIHIPAMKLILLLLAFWGMDVAGLFNASNGFKIAYIAATLAIVFGGAFLSHKLLEIPAKQAVKRFFA